MLTLGQLHILSFWANFNLNVICRTELNRILSMVSHLHSNNNNVFSSHVISELYSVIGFGVIILLL